MSDDSCQVIGNGDVFGWQDHAKALESGNVATTYVARGALVKPWIFTEIKERRDWDISAGERLDIVRQYVRHGLEVRWPVWSELSRNSPPLTCRSLARSLDSTGGAIRRALKTPGGFCSSGSALPTDTSRSGFLRRCRSGPTGGRLLLWDGATWRPCWRAATPPTGSGYRRGSWVPRRTATIFTPSTKQSRTRRRAASQPVWKTADQPSEADDQFPGKAVVRGQFFYFILNYIGHPSPPLLVPNACHVCHVARRHFRSAVSR